MRYSHFTESIIHSRTEAKRTDASERTGHKSALDINGCFEGFEWLFMLNRSGRHFACEPLCLVATNCSVISLWVYMRGYCNGFVLTYQIDLRSSWGFFSPPLHPLTLITGEKRSQRLCCAGFLCTLCVAVKSKNEKRKIN